MHHENFDYLDIIYSIIVIKILIIEYLKKEKKIKALNLFRN